MSDSDTTNTAQQLMYRAAVLLDEQDFPGAEEALRDAVNVATIAGRDLELVQAKGFLGELLLGLDRAEEALEQFEDILEIARNTEIDLEEIQPELRLARELVSREHGGE